jgi:superfamily II DNA/RNA helicase
MVKPLPHQSKVVNFLSNDKNRGLILFHSVGSGKTLTSLFSAKKLLTKYPTKKVIISAPKSIVGNFIKEMKKLHLDNDPRITITTPGVLVNILKDSTRVCKDTIFILDEAHNFGKKGVRSKHLIECSKRAFKVILLTASLVKNKPDEINNLLSMVSLEKDSSKNLKCKISYYTTSHETKDYPRIKTHIVRIKMSEEYYKEYYKIQENIKQDLPEVYLKSRDLTKFLNGARRAVNQVKVVSPKIIWTIKKIISDLRDNKKILIYSTWKMLGIHIITDALRKYNISFSEISGNLTKDERIHNVKLFNTGVNRVILITSAGSEGIDLKEVRSVVLLEPFWNFARTEQVIGRAVRFRSHSNLPFNKRTVDIYSLILTKP